MEGVMQTCLPPPAKFPSASTASLVHGWASFSLDDRMAGLCGPKTRSKRSAQSWSVTCACASARPDATRTSSAPMRRDTTMTPCAWSRSNVRLMPRSSAFTAPTRTSPRRRPARAIQFGRTATTSSRGRNDCFANGFASNTAHDHSRKSDQNSHSVRFWSDFVIQAGRVTPFRAERWGERPREPYPVLAVGCRMFPQPGGPCSALFLLILILILICCGPSLNGCWLFAVRCSLFGVYLTPRAWRLPLRALPFAWLFDVPPIW